jgi:hypothetical protein
MSSACTPVSALCPSLHVTAGFTRSAIYRRMIGSRTLSLVASLLGSAFPMRLKYVYTLATQKIPVRIDNATGVSQQHYRIIAKGSSEGFSPWFLLLGSTSSASGMLNMCARCLSLVATARRFSIACPGLLCSKPWLDVVATT